MKKQSLVIILGVLLVAIGCARQETEHLKFMDVSMGLNMDKFTKALEKKEFKHITKEPQATIMEGKFCGDHVQIAIFETPETKQIAMVAVEFPTYANKSTARDMYDRYGKMLDEKYSGYFKNKQSKYFQNLIEIPDADNLHGKPGTTIGDYYTYFAVWEIPTGEIVSRVYNTSQFNVIYADKLNYEALRDTAKSNDL
mgnify:CR=1 FL=1